MKLLSFITVALSLHLLSCTGIKATTSANNVPIPVTAYTHNTWMPKEKLKVFTYFWKIKANQEVVLYFDSTNIGRGDNYKFVEFLQMVPLQPVKYTFDVRVRKNHPLKNGARYTDFYIYNFKVVIPKLTT